MTELLGLKPGYAAVRFLPLNGSSDERKNKEVVLARVKKILAPTDFSDLSKRGVRYALEIARDTSAEVIVYYAIDVTSEWHDRPAIPRPYHDMPEDTRNQLDKFLADHFADCIDLIEVRKVVELGAMAAPG